jgi:hypothetical protein
MTGHQKIILQRIYQCFVSFIFDVFIRMTKSRRIRWSAYVTLMEKENVYRGLVAKPV